MYRSVQRIIRKFKDGSWDGGPDDSKEVPRILPDREELSNSHSFLRWLNSPDGSLYDFDDLNVGFMVDYYEETLASQSRSRNYHNSSSSIGGNREKGNQLELGPRPATPDAGGQSFSVLLDDVTNSLKRLSLSATFPAEEGWWTPPHSEPRTPLSSRSSFLLGPWAGNVGPLDATSGGCNEEIRQELNDISRSLSTCHGLSDIFSDHADKMQVISLLKFQHGHHSPHNLKVLYVTTDETADAFLETEHEAVNWVFDTISLILSDGYLAHRFCVPLKKFSKHSMDIGYWGPVISFIQLVHEEALIPRPLPISDQILRMNNALRRVTNPPLPIHISGSLYPLLLFYNAQIGQAFPIEYLLDFCGIYVHELLWRHRKYGKIQFFQHPAFFDIDYHDTSNSFVDTPNFDVERTSKLPLDRIPRFILLLQIFQQPPSLRVIKRNPWEVPDWHRIDHLICIGYREYFWVIYSPAEASFCINYALKTWRRVYQHEPELFSQERFGQIPKLEADAIGRKRSGRSFRRSITSSSSSLLNDSEVRSKNIDKFLTTGIKEKREYLPKTHKINNEHHSSGPQITFETLFSDLAKSSSQNYVIKDKIISSLKRVFGGNSDSLRGTRRMIWKCKCGCTSYDDFSEWPGQEGAIVEFAKELMQAGYITQAQITRQPGRTNNWAPRKPQNGLNLISRIIPRIRQTSLPVFVQSSSKKSTVCLPVDKCRWLHLCMKKRPYATHLKPLHVCKDDEQNPLTDKTFFKALKQAYSKEKTWKDWLIFKLEKIEFIGFEACPDDYVDHIKPNDLPSTTNEYDFVPPLSSKMVPPIGPKHMLHLFQNCSAISQVNSSFYLQRIPRRKIEPITFKANSLNDNLGWGLHFVEGLNTSLAVTVMFIVSSILGIGFAICWTMLEKDIQGAFAVAAYVTSVATLAVMTWQMRAL